MVVVPRRKRTPWTWPWPCCSFKLQEARKNRAPMTFTYRVREDIVRTKEQQVYNSESVSHTNVQIPRVYMFKFPVINPCLTFVLPDNIFVAGVVLEHEVFDSEKEKNLLDISCFEFHLCNEIPMTMTKRNMRWCTAIPLLTARSSNKATGFQRSNHH